jgi:outer membrane protein OmpA-like peptidoglycan-associated protein/Flp pilus assembly protein TadD
LHQGLLYLEVPDLTENPLLEVAQDRIRIGRAGSKEGAELLVSYAGGMLRITVARGKATLQRRSGRALTVTAGESLFSRPDGKMAKSAAATYFEDTRWVRSLISARVPAIGVIRFADVSNRVTKHKSVRRARAHRGRGVRPGALVPTRVMVRAYLHGAYARTVVTHEWRLAESGLPKEQQATRAALVKAARFVFDAPRHAVITEIKAGRPPALEKAVLRRIRRAGAQDGLQDGPVRLVAPKRHNAIWRAGNPVQIPLGDAFAEAQRAGAVFRVVVTYGELLPASGKLRRYVFPLAGGTKQRTLDRFCFSYLFFGQAEEVSSPYYRLAESSKDGKPKATFCEDRFRARGNLELAWPVAEKDAVIRARSWKSPQGDRYAVFPLRPKRLLESVEDERRVVTLAADGAADSKTVAPARRVWLLVDRSRSLWTQQTRMRQAVAAVLGRLTARDRFGLVAVGTDGQAWKAHPVKATPANRRSAVQWVAALEPEGATDLKAALARAAQVVPRGAQVIYIGDGVTTVGEVTVERWVEAVRRGFSKGRLDVLGLGTYRDRAALQTLARAGRGRTFLPRSTDELVQAAAVLAGAGWMPAFESIRLAVDGAKSVYPIAVGATALHEELVAVARIPAGRKVPASLRLEVRHQGKHIRRNVPVRWGRGTPVLQKLWAQRHLENFTLLRRHGRGLVALSRKLGVRCSASAFRLSSIKATTGHSVMRKGSSYPSAQLGSVFAPLQPFSESGSLDSDSDQIADIDDECPHEPETFNGFMDEDGCPDKGRVEVGREQIKILDKIYFATRKATIRAQSYPLLDAIASTLKGHPHISLVEIAGHTDERRSADIRNKKLSLLRAQAVKKALVERGVEAHRLTPKGYGASRPLDRRHNEKAWAKNRRVEFLILKRRTASRKVRNKARKFTIHPIEFRQTDAARPELTSLQRAVTQDPSTRRKRWALVNALRSANQNKAALKRALAWRRWDPMNLGVHRLVGDIGWALGKKRFARTIYANIAELVPRQPEALRLVGALLTQRGDLANAVRYLSQAHHARPADPCYGLELADLYVRTGKHRQAVELMSSLAALFSGRQPLVATRALEILSRIRKARSGRGLRKIRRLLAKVAFKPQGVTVRSVWDPLLGPLALRLITPDGRRISRTHSWGRHGERFLSACHAVSAITVPTAQVGDYKVELLLPQGASRTARSGRLHVSTGRSPRRGKKKIFDYQLHLTGKPQRVLKIVARR